MQPLRIGFFCESCLPFSADSLDERPLGGTETGIIRLAEQLAFMGHHVEVFTRGDHKASSSDQLPNSNQPLYRPVHAIHAAHEFDALVLVKDYRPATFKLPAKKIFYLTGDGPEQYVNFGIGDKRIIDALHGMLCVSDWQADVLCETSGFPRNKAFFIGNGVHLPYFEGKEQRHPNRLFYASSPNRGLHFAYLAFQMLLKLNPSAELHVFAGFDVYDDAKKFSGPLVQHFEALKSVMEKNPSVVMRGNLTQAALAREMMKSSVLFYPNQFVETSCIVGLEAQAAGCAVIATHAGGLPETIGDRGVLVTQPVGSQDYLLEFAQHAHLLLSDPKKLRKIGEGARSYIFRECGWGKVARRFEQLLQRTFS